MHACLHTCMHTHTHPHTHTHTRTHACTHTHTHTRTHTHMHAHTHACMHTHMHPFIALHFHQQGPIFYKGETHLSPSAMWKYLPHGYFHKKQDGQNTDGGRKSSLTLLGWNLMPYISTLRAVSSKLMSASAGDSPLKWQVTARWRRCCGCVVSQQVQHTRTGYISIYSPITFKCTQEFVLLIFPWYDFALRQSITLCHTHTQAASDSP